jgi:hypothetical protein
MQVRRVSIHGGWVGEPHAPTGRGTATARESTGALSDLTGQRTTSASREDSR